MKTTLLTTCTSATEAEQIQKKLKLAGLKCKLHKVNHKEDANLHEIEVLVAESDYQRALEAMNAPEVQEVSPAPQSASQKAMNIEELLTRAVFYFIGLPAVLFLLHTFTGRTQSWQYYLVHGFFFALFMTSFHFFQKKRNR